MTRAEAKRALTYTWLFKPVADTIALREVALIEAVREQGGVAPALLPYKVRHLPVTPGCASFQRT